MTEAQDDLQSWVKSAFPIDLGEGHRCSWLMSET